MVHKYLFGWATKLLTRMKSRLNQGTIAIHKGKALKYGYQQKTNDSHLFQTFSKALESLEVPLDQDIASKLHFALVTKVFHAQAKDEVKEYEAKKITLFKAKEKSKQAFRTSLQADSERKRAKEEKRGGSRPTKRRKL